MFHAHALVDHDDASMHSHHLDIPTFDASDVEHKLTKDKSRLERSLGKFLIAVISYNPLPLLHVALVDAHVNHHAKHKKTRSIGFDATSSDDGLDDLHVQKTNDVPGGLGAHQPLPVDDHPPAIQSAFRQSVLRSLIIYVSVVLVSVVASLLWLPALVEQVIVNNSSLLVSAMSASASIVVVLSMVLLFVLRFDSPVNFAGLGLLTLTEIIWLVIFVDPHKLVSGLTLLVSGLILQSVIACRIPRCKTTGQPLEMTTLATAAVGSVGVLAAVALPLNIVMGSDVTRLSGSGACKAVVIVGVAILWVSQVLSVLTHTMPPANHASAIVFFQADLAVLLLVMPTRAVHKQLRQIMRYLNQHRDGTASSPSGRDNAVLPFAIQEGLADVTSRSSSSTQLTTPVYPVHMIPSRGRASSHTAHAAEGVDVDAREGKTTNQGGPRHRNSVCD